MQAKLCRVSVTALAAATVFAAAPAAAHEAGDWLVKVGVTHIKPKSDNGKVIDDSVGIDVGSSTRPSFSLTYMATKNVGVELLGAFPFKHDIDAAGLGNIGSTRHLPPTLSLQWHFLPDSKVQPYVGVGVNYTTFFRTRSVLGDLHLSDSWGRTSGTSTSSRRYGVTASISARFVSTRWWPRWESATVSELRPRGNRATGHPKGWPVCFGNPPGWVCPSSKCYNPRV